jgi:hypothetical protein
VRQWHYSGKVVNNSQIHLGAFLDGRCGGVMQFGPSLDKRKLVGLVRGTLWNEFIELNRMAFAEWMPRNGESRCLAVAFRLLRKHYPHLKWVVSFADATQSGDGAIYRASGFVLTLISEYGGLIQLPDGRVVHRASFCDKTSNVYHEFVPALKGKCAGQKTIEKITGGRILPGHQLRYVYFMHPEERANLAVPEIPFSRIAELGAGMYRGKPRALTSEAPSQGVAGGANPTRSLQESEQAQA